MTQLASRTVCVIGSGTDPHTALAQQVGRLLARLEVNLLTGGGAGVMEAVSKAFVEAEPARGITIGILPCDSGGAASLPPGDPNPFVQLAIRTHLSDRGEQGELPTSRNHINVLTADAIVALPGGPGTASELRLAETYRKPVIRFTGDVAALEAALLRCLRSSEPAEDHHQQ